MNTIFGNFIENIIPTLRKATLKLNISGQETEMTVEDFKTAIVPEIPEPYEPPYKVYTALLTQSGGDNLQYIDTGTLTIGVTYLIYNNSPGMDFTNVGAPNNDVATYFVATGTTPNSWGTPPGPGFQILRYNTGAPVVTVLENTLGNITFIYQSSGDYSISGSNLFTINKTWGFASSLIDQANMSIEPVLLNINDGDENTIYIRTQGGDYNGDGLLNKTPIEIRVYN